MHSNALVDEPLIIPRSDGARRNFKETVPIVVCTWVGYGDLRSPLSHSARSATDITLLRGLLAMNRRACLAGNPVDLLPAVHSAQCRLTID